MPSISKAVNDFAADWSELFMVKVHLIILRRKRYFMRTFASPSRYIQGEDALFENAKQILNLGNLNFCFDNT